MKLWKIVLLTIAAALALAIAAGVVGLVLYLKFDIALGPRDLNLVSVEVIPTADTPQKFASDDRDPRPGLSYRITLTSRANLGDIADDWGMNTFVIPRFHIRRGGRAAYPWIFGPFQDGRRLPAASSKEDDAARRASPSSSLYVYEVYLRAIDTGRYEDDFNTEVPYDLVARPEPVSLKLGGGNMALQAFRTNEVEIPPQAFVDAYARYQRNQPR